ncbi:hypothetical protein O3P69_006239 [Scylla paramamosain]|uniref:RNA-directed DNA polymerase n=1 Tax=Scylla paramamosain TaxID=85552 RepID=A0AAW0U6U3_SCYPA
MEQRELGPYWLGSRIYHNPTSTWSITTDPTRGHEDGILMVVVGTEGVSMAAVIGAVKQYIEGKDFEVYTESFEQFLEANNFMEDKRRFVCGLHVERIKRKLLQEGDELTWDKVCKLALSMEAASTEAKLLAGGNHDTQVNKVEPPRTAPRNRKRELDDKGAKGQNARFFFPGSEARDNGWCSRSGSNYHKATDCPFKEQECFKFSRMGHTRRMCRAGGRVNNLDNDNEHKSSQEEEGKLFDILQLPEWAQTSIKTPLVVNVQGEGKELRMEVDTGASNTVTSEEVWSKLHSRPRLEASNKPLITYTGERVQTLGHMSIKAYLQLKEGARPVSRKSRPVPHALYPSWTRKWKGGSRKGSPNRWKSATAVVGRPRWYPKQTASTELKPISETTEAIQQLPAPVDVPTLQSLLGTVGYYSRLLPHLATTLTPLYELRKKGAKWLVTDANDVGVWATLIQVGPGDVEWPVAYASRVLTPTERKHPSVEKEAVAVSYGVKRFHQYCYMRRFTLIMDNKALSRILNPEREMPTLRAALMQRYALQLAAYSYDVDLRRSEDMRFADTLSRLPMSGNIDKGPQRVEREAKESNVLFLDKWPSVTLREVATATRRDSVLGKVMTAVRSGICLEVSEDISSYKSRMAELSTERDCLMWGGRVVIPASLREKEDSVTQDNDWQSPAEGSTANLVEDSETVGTPTLRQPDVRTSTKTGYTGKTGPMNEEAVEREQAGSATRGGTSRPKRVGESTGCKMSPVPGGMRVGGQVSAEGRLSTGTGQPSKGEGPHEKAIDEAEEGTM